MTRQEKLIDLVMRWRNRPYVWGESDCGCFAFENIEILTGKSMAAMKREKGWLASAKFLIEHGWENVSDLMNEVYKPSVDISQATLGDIILYEYGEDLHLAVLVGNEALTPGRTGLITIEKKYWRRAWLVN